ncbi:hypothetical protein [Amycolatopsis sp. NPDC004079]|uniref:hypothetical protein n=1 Tax=Amycolatopsis sp. NPDC004079 TaxID=3154549 RepID=UPI0033AF62FC
MSRLSARERRHQPVSPTLIRLLLDHAADRGSTHPYGQLLRCRSGEPITKRRYDHLWKRLSFVRNQNISTHWLRHTTLTWVERRFGCGTAHAYAGHFDSGDNATVTYIRASIHGVATALAALTSEPHSLARAQQPLMRAYPGARVQAGVARRVDAVTVKVHLLWAARSVGGEDLERQTAIVRQRYVGQSWMPIRS